MKKQCMIKACIFALLSFTLMAAPMFGQSSATLSGTVTDATAGVMPGATVTATNTETGQEQSATVNNSGVYSFPALQPGTYTVVARKAGFQSKTITDVRLRAGSQSNLPFTLEVSGTTTEIDVVATAETMILEAGSSTGTVMQEQLVAELPLVGSNVMELLNSMGGVIKAEEPIFGASNQSFAGINGGSINVTRDGVAAGELRYNSGVTGTSYINPELVGEFKMILSPVDAELGRGAGQVQVTTRSGSNAFHGSGIWNNQNTVLDARKFEDKRQGISPPWRNVNNYTLTISGPIVKNKTFFFASWDQQIVRNKEWAVVSALTPCAKKGIYRYYDHVVSINPVDSADYSRFDTTAYPRRVTVKSAEDGTPNLSDKPAISNGQLMYESVFGPLSPADRSLLNTSYTTDCANYTPPSALGAAWDGTTNRSYFDKTGYVDKYVNTYMPDTNYYGLGDGLNTAGIRWWRTTTGTNNVYGLGEDNRRKQFTVKIDHNINSEHRFSGTYSIEKNAGEDGGVSWPENSWIGRNERKPQSLTLMLTSTLAPTLLNEFRFGYNRTTAYVRSSIDASDGGLPVVLNDLTANIPNVHDKIENPIVLSHNELYFGPILGFIASPPVSSPYMSRGLMNDTWGGTDNYWNISESITWMKGSHSFKGGVNFRNNQAFYTQDGMKSGTGPFIPAIRLGDMSQAMTRTEASWLDGWSGIEPYNPGGGAALQSGLSSQNSLNGTTTNMSQGGVVTNMLTFLSGSVNGIYQAFYIVKNANGGYDWNDVSQGQRYYENDIRSRELSLFFKDDWKITSDLTLNLGVRYEYYGVPWNNNGMTAALEGGSPSIQGNVGPTWMSWLGLDAPSKATKYEFVGPNSENPGRSPWSKDWNNFAPHVGFSWQLPWLGRGLTTLRGGYSISYLPINNFDNYSTVIVTVPGTSSSYTCAIGNATCDANYMNLETVGKFLGDRSKVIPPIPVMNPMQYFNGSVTVYDENLRNPYTHSLNMALTRQLGRVLTLDIRYIGNLSRNQLSPTNLNTPKYMSNGLIQEFEALRKSGSATPDSQIPIMAKILGPSAATVPGRTVAAMVSAQNGMMNFINYGDGRTPLINGDYNTLATNLAYYGAVAGVTGSQLSKEGLDANFIVTNPAIQTANITTNAGFTNYHSMQTQVTMRPARGLSFQATYTWSRNIQDRGVENFDTGSRRYYLADAHRSHSLTTYGSYELPFGARGFLFRDASGAFKKAIEGWNLSWVGNISSGAPVSLTGGSSYWGINQVNVVRPDLWDNKAGHVENYWNPDGTWSHGTFYGDRYVKVHDPSCDKIAAEFQTVCRNNRRAIVINDQFAQDYLKQPDPASDAARAAYENITFVIVNAEPGSDKSKNIGNMLPNSLTGPGRWNLDMAISKSVEFLEGKIIDFRIDAANIFNHATTTGTSDTFNHAPRYDVINQPQIGLNTADRLGYMATKSGHRTFQAKISIRF